MIIGSFLSFYSIVIQLRCQFTLSAEILGAKSRSAQILGAESIGAKILGAVILGTNILGAETTWCRNTGC